MSESKSPSPAMSNSAEGSIQFDLRGIGALTVVAASVFAIGRYFLDAGAILALVLGPAVLTFAVGTLRTRKRATLGALAVIVPLLSVVVGLFIQCMVWGVVYRITWILFATPALTTIVTIALFGIAKTQRQAIAFCSVLIIILCVFIAFRFHSSSAERWAAQKFNIAGDRRAGWVRHQPLFNLPVTYGSDLRSSEGIGMNWLTSARLLFGLSESASLMIQEPLSDEEWKNVGHLTGLRYLTISAVSPNDVALEAIGRLEALEELSFQDCEVNLGVEHLKSLKKLKGVAFHNSSLHKCAALANVESLEGIGLYGASTADSKLLLDQILQLPRLKYLMAPNVGIESQDLRRLMAAKESYFDSGSRDWLEIFSMNASSVDNETLIEMLNQTKYPQWAIGKLGLSDRQLQALQAKMDESDGFVKSD